VQRVGVLSVDEGGAACGSRLDDLDGGQAEDGFVKAEGYAEVGLLLATCLEGNEDCFIISQ
jgi:hypothetical protein